MRITKILLVLAASILITSCAAGRSPVSAGFFFSNVGGPEGVSSNTLGSKHGSACALNVLGLFAAGDASINAAAKNGGITKVSHVDYSTSSILMLYANSCTEVYGE